MNESTTRIDLTPFCASERRPFFAAADAVRPFVARGYRYATCGRICVRVPAPGEPDTVGEFPSRVGEVVDWDDDAGYTEPWPAGPYASGDAECEECDGDGVTSDGEGECPACKGTGRAVRELYLRLGFSAVRADLARLIASLPGITYDPRKAHSVSRRAIRFRFDGGGQGAVMPYAAKAAV